jgi:signal transduction histidine kinase
MSIKYRIAFFFASLVTLLFAIISVSVYFFSVTERNNLFKTRLKNRALSTARVYAEIHDSNYVVLRRMDAYAAASLYDKSITITGYNNEPQYQFSDKPGDSLYLTSKMVEQAKINDEFYFSYEGKKAIAIHHLDQEANFIVAVAARDLDGKEYLAQLKEILWLSLGLSVILSFATGLVFAKSLIRPMAQITGEVNLITSNNLAQRIKINHAGDELSKLAITFNNLLDRLQDSFAIQRRFISNASHELSTPLTSVSSQLEVALQKNRSTEEYQEVLQSIREDIKELQQLTHSLLDIAKAGSHGGIDLAEVRLDEVLLKAMTDIQKQHKKFKVRFDFNVFPEEEKLLTVFGNSNLLYIALKNIIENGCKYSDDGQSYVTVDFNKTAISIKVFNEGDVISEADIQNIFHPFFRADSALPKPGFGLGLTLSKRILSLHKGNITVESSPEKGTLFIIDLPNVLSFY